MDNRANSLTAAFQTDYRTCVPARVYFPFLERFVSRHNNGTIDPTDFTIWRANYGTLAPGSGASLANNLVPEPASLLMVSIATISLTLLRGSTLRRS